MLSYVSRVKIANRVSCCWPGRFAASSVRWMRRPTAVGVDDGVPPVHARERTLGRTWGLVIAQKSFWNCASSAALRSEIAQ